MSPKDLHFADEETLEALEEAYFDVLGEHGGVNFGEIVEDVPLFVEHCEAVAVTRRWLDEQERHRLSFSFDVLPKRRAVPEVVCAPSIIGSPLLLPA